MRGQEMAFTDQVKNWRGLGERVPVWQFVRFVLVGLLNTAFGYGAFALLIVLGLRYPLAAFLATVAGVLFNFKSYGTLVFGSHDNRLLLRFFAVYGVCYLVNLIPLAWAERNDISLLIAGAVIALPMAALSFVLNRRFVFTRRA